MKKRINTNSAARAVICQRKVKLQLSTKAVVILVGTSVCVLVEGEEPVTSLGV